MGTHFLHLTSLPHITWSTSTNQFSGTTMRREFLLLTALYLPGCYGQTQPFVKAVHQDAALSQLFNGGCFCLHGATCLGPDSARYCSCINFYSGTSCEVEPQCLTNN